MSIIPKETGLNFGQEGRRSNVYGNGAEDGFFIGYIFPVSGELQRASHTLTTCDQLSNFQFDLHPDGKPVVRNINYKNPQTMPTPISGSDQQALDTMLIQAAESEDAARAEGSRR